MTNQEIYECVEKYVSTELKNTPFDKGLPHLQNFVWNLGDKTGKTGPEILKIYFDIKSQSYQEQTK